MTDDEKKYGMFNGRRSADEYVKGYLKAVVAISGIGLSLMIGFGGWAGISIIGNQRVNAEQDAEIRNIKDSRFTSADGNKLQSQIVDNRLVAKEITAKLDYIINDIQEFKTILKRTAPYERKNGV